jgi:hypothetical protein
LIDSPAIADAIDPAHVRRALVIKLRHHGDVLLASPVFSVLKRAAPHAEVDALVYRETASMLAGHPSISVLHTIDRSLRQQGVLARLRGEWRLWQALRERGYDLVVHLTEHPRGAWLKQLVGARYGVARERDDAGWWWRASFSHHYLLPRHTLRHTVETNLDAVRRIGWWPDDVDKALVLVPGADAEARAQSLLQTHGLARKSFLLIHPGSRWLFKCWPAASTAALLDRLAAAGLAVGGDWRTGSGRACARDSDQGGNVRTDHRLVGAVVAVGTGRIDRRGAALHRCRFGTDAHRRGDAHAGGRVVRTERRCRVGSVDGPASRGCFDRAPVPSLRQQRLRRQQPLGLSVDAARSARCRGRR